MPAPSALRLDHAVVAVHDASAARAFYRDTLGLTLVSALQGDAWGGRRWLMMIFALGTGGQHLSVTAFSGIDQAPTSPFPPDARHVAFAVDARAEWEAWKARVVAAKASHWEESHGEQESLYIVDPSGNVVEITTPPSPAPVLRDEGKANALVDAWLVADRDRSAGV